MDWSKISPKILDLLARKYIVYFEDYPDFAGVCKSWHLAALQAAKGNGPPSRLPSLMLSEKIGDEEFRELFLLSNKTIRKIQLPEVCGKICLSSCGWLVTVSTVANDYSPKLINPLSRQIINLPKTDTFSSFTSHLEKETSFRKLVFLAQWSLVVVSWRFSGELAFCRIGETKWTPVDKGSHGIMDITYYGGRVYLCDINFCIKTWDGTKIGEVTSLPTDAVNAHCDAGELNGYIIGLDEGERKRLLVVMRQGTVDYGNDGVHYQTHRFQVWGYYLGRKKGKWSRVTDLGTKSLFVGLSSSFWVEQDTTGAIKGNCIYFTDDLTEWYRDCKTGGGRDMGIYHLSDGTIEPHFKGESRSYLTPPIWLESMFTRFD